MSLANEDVTAALDRLTELHAAATPGPWEVRWQCPEEPHHHDHDEGWIADPDGATIAVLSERYTAAPADAALIVAAVDALPRLLAAIRAAYGLHTPIDRGTGPQCQGCATHITFTPWPCATVRALDEALEVPGA